MHLIPIGPDRDGDTTDSIQQLVEPRIILYVQCGDDHQRVIMRHVTMASTLSPVVPRPSYTTVELALHLLETNRGYGVLLLPETLPTHSR